MTEPRSATRIQPRFGLWRATRTHQCQEHKVLDRKWFWSKDTAQRWAHNWMTYRWVHCHNTQGG